MKLESFLNDMPSGWSKYKGALFAEHIRILFSEKGFNISQNNSFIKNNPIEYDFLILKPGIKTNTHFYNKEDVIMVLEVKTSGTRTYESYKKIFNDFVQSGIKKCIYINLSETTSWQKKLNEKCGKFPYMNFTLFWDKSSKRKFKKGDDFQNIINYMKG